MGRGANVDDTGGNIKNDRCSCRHVVNELQSKKFTKKCGQSSAMLRMIG